MIFNKTTEPILAPLLKKGLHELPFEDYLKAHGASSHGLMDIRRSPKYYQHRKSMVQTKKASFEFGTLVHGLVLEPDLIDKKVKVSPECDRRTTIGKQIYAEFMETVRPTDIVVDKETYENGLKIRDSLFLHPYTKELIKKPGAKKENAGFWVHETYEMFCKIKPDIAYEEHGWIIDVKTCANGSPKQFQKDMINFNYDLQAAFYMDGFKKITGRPAQGFIFLCVENTAPFDIAIYTPEAKVIEHGRHKYQQALATMQECCQTGHWPGYAEQAMSLELPGWAVWQEQE